MQFDSLDDISAFCRDLPAGDAAAADAAALRQQALTKPPGSLGRLEELAIWLMAAPPAAKFATICSVTACG